MGRDTDSFFDVFLINQSLSSFVDGDELSTQPSTLVNTSIDESRKRELHIMMITIKK